MNLQESSRTRCFVWENNAAAAAAAAPPSVPKSQCSHCLLLGWQCLSERTFFRKMFGIKRSLKTVCTLTIKLNSGLDVHQLCFCNCVFSLYVVLFIFFPSAFHQHDQILHLNFWNFTRFPFTICSRCNSAKTSLASDMKTAAAAFLCLYIEEQKKKKGAVLQLCFQEGSVIWNRSQQFLKSPRLLVPQQGGRIFCEVPSLHNLPLGSRPALWNSTRHYTSAQAGRLSRAT